MIEDYFIRRDVILEEVRGDVTTVGEDYLLVAFISRDLVFKGKVASRLEEDYGFRGLLVRKRFSRSSEKVFVVEVPVYYYGRMDRLLIANVVSKAHHWERPTYESVGEGLLSLRREMQRLGVRKAAMSVDDCCEGCLEWRDVKRVIYDNLKGSYINIRAYT